MKKKEFIGIDVSKKTLDVWLYFAREYNKFENNPKGHAKLLQWIKQLVSVDLETTVFCFEHTGIYSFPLCIYLTEQGITYYQVSGLMVKRSLGLARGKNDKVDAKHLAEFAFRHHDRLVPYQIPSKTVLALKKLIALRIRFVRQRSGFKNEVREIKAMGLTSLHQEVMDQSREMISILNKKIKFLEKKIKCLISDNPEVNQTFTKITAIKGVGMILGATMIASTNNFKSFDRWRKFACYVGTAPFEHLSGTSYRGRTRVSVLGNRHIKSTLWLAALSSIQYNPEMKEYYHRKVDEGKPKLAVLNGVCNKLLSRIFAVALRKDAFVDIYKFAA
jgi:transposase